MAFSATYLSTAAELVAFSNTTLRKLSIYYSALLLLVLPSLSIYNLLPSVSLISKLVYYGTKKPHCESPGASSHILSKHKQL